VEISEEQLQKLLESAVEKALKNVPKATKKKSTKKATKKTTKKAAKKAEKKWTAEEAEIISPPRPPIQKVKVRCLGPCKREFQIYPSQYTYETDEKGNRVAGYKCNDCMVGRFRA